MKTSGRLLDIRTASDTQTVAIYPNDYWLNRTGPTDFWLHKTAFSAWTIWGIPKRWTDFLIHSNSDYCPEVAIFSGRVVADLLEAGLADGDFLPLEIRDSPIHYFGFYPRATIQIDKVDVSAKMGYDSPSFTSSPNYENYQGHAFVLGQIGKRKCDEHVRSILCIPAVMELAKAKKWTCARFSGYDGGPDLYECNDRGKVLKDNQHPAESIIDDYYVEPEVIAADLVRAREHAAELLASPNLPEWTRRSFEIVRKALAEAPHTLGYPLPESAKPRRVYREGAPLLDPKDIKRIKLEDDGSYSGEIPLSRPLFGSDTLSVEVNDDVVDEDAPEITFTKAELKRRVQSILEKLENCLPTIEAEIEKLAASYEMTPAAHRAELHDPGILIGISDQTKSDRWTFVLKDDLNAHHFEFDGLRLIETWSGD